jgi:hypothetical protein
MPRWLAVTTYVVAAALLTSIGLTVWVVLLFPAWVAAISTAILVMNYRDVAEEEEPDDPSESQ